MLLALVPWIASPSLIQFGISTLLLATLAQSWNIIGGYTGYASFGNSVFYGLGSYGVAIAMVQWHLPFGVGLALGAVLAVLFALLLGLPVLRLRGHYFAICTLALAEVMTAIVSNLEIAGRNIGLVLPLLRGDALFYELALGLLVLTTLAVIWHRPQPLRLRPHRHPRERGSRGRDGRQHHALQGARRSRSPASSRRWRAASTPTGSRSSIRSARSTSRSTSR